MMKLLVLCAAFTLLAGCANLTQTKKPTPGPRPDGIVILLNDSSGNVYTDLRTVSTYQGNPHLRRFYLISNYNEPRRVRDNPPVYIASSRVINVVNCDTHQRALFERIYFSDYWGEGEAIAKRGSVGQWESYPEESLIGIVAGMTCQIKPERLKPEPAKDTRPTLLGGFDE